VYENTKGLVKKVTEQYLQRNIDDFDDIEYAEKEIQIDLGDGIMVNGRMDLIKKININGKEHTTIVDFKSQKDAQKTEVTMDQLALYALGYQELNGTKADMLQIVNLDEGHQTFTNQKLDNSNLEEIKEKIINSANEIRANKLNKTCDINICNECYYKALCSKGDI
jgi:DNA helicase-2/ATP-dependent DNA helicase PcrA